jgi:signal recognition particle receptor subunit beta
MVQINFAQKQVNAKIVFYGPGMSGKTTNLEIVHQRAPAPNRGELTSISTDGDRTLFFDFMPLDLGTVAGMRTCFQLYTVPGQVYYNSTRKLVLQGVDGVVFVADSSASMVEENLESMRNLEQNLAEYGKSLASMPLIIQYNKRDLPDALPVEELQRLLNPYGAPCFEAIANTGQGVFPTLKALAARVLESIHTGTRSAPPAPGIQAGLSQTGFHPAPALGAPGAAVQRTLQQPGYAAGPQVQPQITPQAPAGVQPARSIAMQPAAQPGMAPQAQQGGPGYADPLSRTTVHAAPGMQQPMGGQPMHPQLQVPGALPHGGMQPQTGYGYPQQGQPQMQQHMQPQMHPQQMQPQMQQQPGLQVRSMQPGVGMQTAPMMAPAHVAPSPTVSMMRVDKPGPASAQGAKPQSAPRPAAQTAARPAAQAARSAAPAAAPADAAPRIQPRNQPMPTPGTGKKRYVYAAIFVVVALGVGAFVAKMVLSVL